MESNEPKNEEGGFLSRWEKLFSQHKENQVKEYHDSEEKGKEIKERAKPEAKKVDNYLESEEGIMAKKILNEAGVSAELFSFTRGRITEGYFLGDRGIFHREEGWDAHGDRYVDTWSMSEHLYYLEKNISGDEIISRIRKYW